MGMKARLQRLRCHMSRLGARIIQRIGPDGAAYRLALQAARRS
jgi:hypothetical protein